MANVWKLIVAAVTEADYSPLPQAKLRKIPVLFTENQQFRSGQVS